MIHTSSGKASLLIASLLFSPGLRAADAAEAWLVRINHAASTMNYEGIFVYQHESRLETMRIVHKVADGSFQERVVSLNGAAREIIRNDEVVRCYLPDENRVVVEHRVSGGKNFPALLPNQVGELLENYQIVLRKTDRVAGRLVQRVLIKPQDEFRYGYELWADRETGLLLKADLLDRHGSVLEQFVFTQVNIGGEIPESELKPEKSGEGMVWYRDTDERASPREGQVSIDTRWTAARLPKGFRLSTRMARNVPMRNRLAEHLVYTDGLAAVSVFIEKFGNGQQLAMEGASRMGAVHAFGKRVGDHQITVVGEVPATTVSLIGRSVTMAK